MPYAPKRPCTYPGCPELTDGGRCEKHRKQNQKEIDARRGSSSARGYGARWQKLREIVLSRDKYLCQECKKLGRLALASDVDHIIPKSKGGIDEMENLQSLCHRCHSSKTAREEGRWN